MKHVYEFFAVTVNGSLCLVRSPSSGLPSVTKIDGKDTDEFPVGTMLPCGGMVSIGKQIITFIPEKHGPLSPLTGIERDLSMVNTRYWCGNTSEVVGLFLSEARARQCLTEGGDLRPADPHWARETQEVLDAIGEDHRHFSIPSSDRLALLYRPSSIAV
ncbi:MAG TPA: hypothetical protein VFT82_01820 [Candidatus Paceibacterota bacterium]|nr:hypothetical protein [Candidatus Paceibacterota bacterium]